MEGIMKFIALTLAATSLLISCNGHTSGSGVIEGTVLDQATVDKFEKELLSRKPGMVTLSKELGKYASIEWNENTGAFESKIDTIDEVEKQTILKVDGDNIYTLSETQDYREVRKESIRKIIHELTHEMPDGSVLSTNGNILTLKFNAGWSFDYETNGHQLSQSSEVAVTASINLDDIRCSENSLMHAVNTATVDGQPIKLPDTTSTNTGSCSPSLSKAELRQIPLKDVSFCDETVDSSDEDDSNCTYNVDMSDLVAE